MKQIIKVNNLTKCFGTFKALDKCVFEVNEGEIFGFIGPSGAGKTTTIKLLTGQLIQDEGEMMILNHSPQDSQIKNEIGIMSDTSGLYEKMTVYENLKVFAELYDVDNSHIDEVLKEVKLFEEKSKKVEKLSKGMKQRVIFARTILHSPKVLFLDEPTANLDPMTAQEVRDIIRFLNEQGTTIFLTTHNMEEADELCDRVAFLNHGHIIESGKPEALKLKYAQNKVCILSQGITSEVELDKDILIETLKKMDSIEMIHSIEPSLREVFLMLSEVEK